ncbi:MAG: hypothetical protein KAW14_09050 [Candidatus Aegiribacteria sp.]|nr:hypothetical protein [Candidatus Aegiribacteria sp.]
MLHPEFVIDKDKRKKAVLLPFPEWEKILDELEELDDIRAFDTAKSSAEESIPFNQAVQEIRENYNA